jgi:exonuclease III
VPDDVEIIIDAPPDPPNPPAAAHRALSAPWSLNIATLNARGLANVTKRRRLFRLLREKHIDIACIQETHCTANDILDWSFPWFNGQSVYSSWACKTGANRSSGVCFLFNRQRFINDDITIEHKDDNDGRFIIVRIAVAPNIHVRVIGLYAPNDSADRRRFFDNMRTVLDGLPTAVDHHVLLGDTNCISDPVLDRFHGAADPSSLAGSLELSQLAAATQTVDIWRRLYPNKQDATFFTTQVGTRLDRIFVDRNVTVFCNAFHERVGISDHRMVRCQIDVPLIRRGQSYWKLNTSVLSRADYQSSSILISARTCLPSTNGNCSSSCRERFRWTILQLWPNSVLPT